MPDRQYVEPFRFNINNLLTLSSANLATQTSAANDKTQKTLHPFFRKRNASMSSNTSDISLNSVGTGTSSENFTESDSSNGKTLLFDCLQYAKKFTASQA